MNCVSLLSCGGGVLMTGQCCFQGNLLNSYKQDSPKSGKREALDCTGLSCHRNRIRIPGEDFWVCRSTLCVSTFTRSLLSLRSKSSPQQPVLKYPLPWNSFSLNTMVHDRLHKVFMLKFILSQCNFLHIFTTDLFEIHPITTASHMLKRYLYGLYKIDINFSNLQLTC
jgi:hypothetical protein